MGDRRIVQWELLPWLEVAPGIRRKIAGGERIMLALYDLAPGIDFPDHSHVHEQMVYVIAGQAEYRIGSEAYTVGPGDVVHIPSGVTHGARVTGDEAVREIDVFSPPREDFMHGPSG